MAVPTLITDLSTTPASNSPAGSENVFPNLDDYLRTQSAFLASIRDNSGNGWVSPYLPLAGGTVSALTVPSLNGGAFSGIRNKITNASMLIDQRNSGAAQTITAAAALAYTVDRFYAYCTGANVTGQRVSGTAPNAYLYRFTGATSVTKIGFAQRIKADDCQDLAGKTATLAADISNGLLTSVTWSVWYANSTDSFGTLAAPTRTLISTGTFTVSATLARYSATISIPSAATTGLEIELSVGAQTGSTWSIGNVQLENGSVATPIELRPIALETQLCGSPDNTTQFGVSPGTSLVATSLNGGAISLRNKILNGSFTVNQRGITTVTPASGDYTADRWAVGASVASKFSISVNAAGSTGVAAGIFGGALTATTLVAYSVAVGETFNVQQKIEGYNIADLAWGTAAAKTVTLSFYTQSSLTGTFGGSIRNGTNTRSYPFSYSIPVANTWTKISITIPGDTSGAFTDWLTTNGIGMSVIFSLGSGSSVSGTAGTWLAGSYTSATGATSIIGTLSATLYLANVQLEVGPVASIFEQIPYGLSLGLCQRYYCTSGASQYFLGYGTTPAAAAICFICWPMTMRAAPTTITTGTFTNGTTLSSAINTGVYSTSFTCVPNSGSAPALGSFTADAEL